MRETPAVRLLPLDGVASQHARQSPAVPGWSEVDFGCLTEPQRAAIRLRLEGSSQDEIARRLGISRAAVRERLDRAVRRLRGNAARTPSDRSWAVDMLLSAEIPRGSMSVGQASQLLVMFAGGATLEQLAEHFGVTKGAVRKRLQRWRRLAVSTDESM